MGGYEFNFCDANAYVNENCIDRDVCLFDWCIDNTCSHVPELHGDLVGPLGVCGPDGTVDLLDILAILDAFGGTYPVGCSKGNFDIQSDTVWCATDGEVSLADVFAVIDAFEGNPNCTCAQGLMGGSAGPGTEFPSEPVGSATFVLVARVEQADSGRLLTVDVLVLGVVDLRGYQVGMTVDSNTSEQLSVESIHIDAERANYVFGGLESVSALDTAKARMFGGLMAGSVTFPGVAYLGTFVFEVPEGVHGTFRFDLQLDDRTILLDRFNRPMVLSIDNSTMSIDLP